MGLLLAMHLKIDGRPLVSRCLENGFLINCIQEKILRFIPPLIISIAEIDALVECLDRILTQTESS
jgi:acetylornithine/N-succinyldiaminopimelate aminotransferase